MRRNVIRLSAAPFGWTKWTVALTFKPLRKNAGHTVSDDIAPHVSALPVVCGPLFEIGFLICAGALIAQVSALLIIVPQCAFTLERVAFNVHLPRIAAVPQLTSAPKLCYLDLQNASEERQRHQHNRGRTTTFLP